MPPFSAASRAGCACRAADLLSGRYRSDSALPGSSPGSNWNSFCSSFLAQYAPWAQRQLWTGTPGAAKAFSALQFPFAQYRPGQRAMAGEIYRACRAGKAPTARAAPAVFCQAPTGIGKTMSALFPALKAMGEGCGAKLFYLTARNTTPSRRRGRQWRGCVPHSPVSPCAV